MKNQKGALKMLSMSTVTALLDGNRAEAREMFESIRTADYISPEDILKQPKRKKLKRYYFRIKDRNLS